MSAPPLRGIRARWSAPDSWPYSWRDLVSGVLDQGLCTGCSGCVLACPRHVVEMNTRIWRPELAPEAWDSGRSADCIYTARGCAMCTRACPRFGAWETDADLSVWGRPRTSDEILGIHRDIFLVASTDRQILEAGQDGGMATATLLYALEHGYIDAALVSNVGPGMGVRPGVARSRDELLAAAGSRYTYSPNTLALTEAMDLEGVERLGMVSVGCQTAMPAVARHRGARRVARRFALTVGLLCCETFDDAIYEDLLLERYGLERSDISWADIKGKLQLWTTADRDSNPDVEIPLKECRLYRRDGCRHCPDFTAEHADISLGGIGKHLNTTVAIVRTDLASELVGAMERDGWITVREARDEDPGAVELITRLAARQRVRWSESPAAAAHPEPGLLPGTESG